MAAPVYGLGIPSVAPARPSAPSALPERCYYEHPETGECVLLVRGRAGYTLATKAPPGDAALLNSVFKVTPIQAKAMWAGATLGWDHPQAQPVAWRKR